MTKCWHMWFMHAHWKYLTLKIKFLIENLIFEIFTLLTWRLFIWLWAKTVVGGNFEFLKYQKLNKSTHCDLGQMIHGKTEGRWKNTTRENDTVESSIISMASNKEVWKIYDQLYREFFFSVFLASKNVQ